jgi:hypothetical protein
MIVSRFKGIAYSPIILTPLFLIVMLSAWFFSDDGLLSAAFLVSLLAFILWLALIYYVMKVYFTALKILPTEIRVRPFLGNAQETTIAFNKLDGYKLLQQSGEHASSEAIIVIQNNKTILQISELFYLNYADIKSEITKKLKLIK